MGQKDIDKACNICGTDLLLYKCKYCGKTYCDGHRLPQGHNCPGLAEYNDLLEKGIIERPGLQPSVVIPEKSMLPVSRPTSLARGAWKTFRLLSLVVIALACLIAVIMLIGFIEKRLPIDSTEIIPIQNTTGARVVLVNNASATDPTYDQLVAFLKADNTSSLKYAYPTWTCADFSRTLHDNAEARGIKAAFVAVEFTDASVDYSVYDPGTGPLTPSPSPDLGHGLNLFNTVDKGPVYVDASSPYGGTSGDRIAYVAEGKEFNEIDLDRATGTDYSSYEAYKQKYLSYVSDLKDYNQQAKAYNLKLDQITSTSSKEERQALNQTHQNLVARQASLEAQKASFGQYYYPSGIVKKIDVYW